MLPNSVYLIKIGFLPIDVWDILDILIVGFMLYQLYRLVKGSVALKIFVGIGALLLSYQVFKLLGMDLLSQIMSSIIGAGFIGIIVIFQPEIRRFLLLLGNSTLRQRQAMINKLLGREDAVLGEVGAAHEALKKALLKLARRRTGALLVLLDDDDPITFITGGVSLNADISEELIVSIFHKESPLHDGAVTIRNQRLKRASTILPVSENTEIPQSLGLRHRAAMGISERTDACCLVVSEESGKISFTREGILEKAISEDRLEVILQRYL